MSGSMPMAGMPMSAMPGMPAMPGVPGTPGMPVSPRRMTLPERLALNVGQALVAWSSRPARRPARRPGRRAAVPRDYNPHEYRERAAARAAREEHWARSAHYHHPWH